MPSIFLCGLFGPVGTWSLEAQRRRQVKGNRWIDHRRSLFGLWNPVARLSRLDRVDDHEGEHANQHGRTDDSTRSCQVRIDARSAGESF